MKYNRLPNLANTYPQITNYTTSNNAISLLGKYPSVNKVDFRVPSLEAIKVVEGTKFRSIIAVYKNQQDSSPKYYTSEFYSRDLEASKIESNPYFLNYSFEQSSIIKIYLEDILPFSEDLRELETKVGVSFVRNNFIIYEESGLVNKTIPSISPNYVQSLLLDQKIKRFEDGLANAETQLLSFGTRLDFNGAKGRFVNIDGETFRAENTGLFFDRRDIAQVKEKIVARISQLKQEKSELDKNSNTNQNTYNLSKPNIQLNPNLIEDGVKNVLDEVISASDTSDIIEINGKFVDCIFLVKYIDWMLSKSTFEEIESGNVIPAEKLSVFKTGVVVNSENTTPTPSQTPSTGTKRYFTYEIIRLSIPATLEQSFMTYRNQFGQTETINVDKYGYVREICAEEDSWGGQFNLFQRTQLEPCNDGSQINQPNVPSTGGGGGGGGRTGIDFIDFNKDQDFVNRDVASRENIQ